MSASQLLPINQINAMPVQTIAGVVNGRPLVFFGGGDGMLYAFAVPSPSGHGGAPGLKKVWSYDCNPPGYRSRDGVPVPHSTDRTPQ